MIESPGREGEECKTVCSLKEHDVAGQLEFFSGCDATFDFRVVSDTCQVYVLGKEVVRKGLSDMKYVPNLVDGLLEHIHAMSVDAPEYVEGWIRPHGMRYELYLSTLAETVAQQFGDDGLFWSQNKQIDFRVQVLPGLRTIRCSWEALADRSPSINLIDFLTLEDYVGEIGEKFYSNMKAALYQHMQMRILRDYQDAEDGGEIVRIMSMSLQNVMKYRKHDITTDFEVPDLDLSISENLWWHCWMWVLDQNHYDSNHDGHISVTETFEASPERGLHDVASADFDIGILDEIWALLTQSQISSQLFLKSTLDRYEAAYILTVGNLTESLPRERIPEFLSLLLPERTQTSISRYNVGEFLKAFAKDGLDSLEVSWTTLRKITRERKRDMDSYTDDSENVLMPDATAYIFNPVSMPIRAWFVIVRFVAIYHLMVVPARIVYRPFTHAGQLELLCTDLPADILTFFHIFVVANTSYQNKKSRWVLSRVKILKNYAAKTFFIDLLASFPFDWLSIAQVC